MPQVSVTIAGRLYRMACGEGEEDRLHQLAARLDNKISELRGAFGEIGDQRITVMAALTMTDDLTEAERRLADLKAQTEGLAAQQAGAADQMARWSDQIAAVVEDTAGRIEGVAQTILAGARRPS